jgi:hypothetical protein
VFRPLQQTNSADPAPLPGLFQQAVMPLAFLVSLSDIHNAIGNFLQYRINHVRTYYEQKRARTVSENLLKQIHEFDRVSIRAVLVANGKNPNHELANAGIHESVAIPVSAGSEQDPTGGILGDGYTPNLTGVLETQYQDNPDHGFASASSHLQMNESSQQNNDDPPARSGTTTLPPAYGLQPFAPVRRSRR